MKIVNIIGGLGNQMFCYAFVKSLKIKYPNESILVDISHFNHYDLHQGFEINKIFNIADIKIATPKDLRKVTWYVPHYYLSRILRYFLPNRKTEFLEKKDYVFDPNVFKISDDCYFEGYWQTPKYFEEIGKDIKKMFKFPEPYGENKSLLNRIQQTNSVAIHIRRGDYLNANSFVGICDLEYYYRAISEIKVKIDNPVYYIFSNDIEWCVQNIKPLIGNSLIIFVTHNNSVNSYWDLFLMSNCKNMILANSSFSWWAAYLNTNDCPFVLSPQKWVNRPYETDIHLDYWKKI